MSIESCFSTYWDFPGEIGVNDLPISKENSFAHGDTYLYDDGQLFHWCEVEDDISVCHMIGGGISKTQADRIAAECNRRAKRKKQNNFFDVAAEVLKLPSCVTALCVTRGAGT